jgi:hypothetical protein
VILLEIEWGTLRWSSIYLLKTCDLV